MSGAIPPFPQYAFMAWCLVKYRDNLTFYLYLSWGVHPDRWSGLPCIGVTSIFCVVCTFILVWMSSTTTTNIIMYKSICTCQACQSGKCAEDMPTVYTYGSLDIGTIVCLTATKFVFCISYVGPRFCLCFGQLHYRKFV
jgi:hypothetical protein